MRPPLAKLRRDFPAGSGIIMLEMFEGPIPANTVGVVQSIDRNGIHVQWENGAEHPVNPEFDRFLPFDLAAYAASEAEEDVADW